MGISEMLTGNAARAGESKVYSMERAGGMLDAYRPTARDARLDALSKTLAAYSGPQSMLSRMYGQKAAGTPVGGLSASLQPTTGGISTLGNTSQAQIDEQAKVDAKIGEVENSEFYNNNKDAFGGVLGDAWAKWKERVDMGRGTGMRTDTTAKPKTMGMRAGFTPAQTG
jgi:hypothetical protein